MLTQKALCVDLLGVFVHIQEAFPGTTKGEQDAQASEMLMQKIKRYPLDDHVS